MFIAVISDIYVGVHKEHKDFWERHMTSLLIKEIVDQERVSSTTGDLLGKLISFLLRATFISRIIAWWRRRKLRKNMEDEILAGIEDYSDFEIEEYEESLFEDISNLSDDTNEKLQEIGSKLAKEEAESEIAVSIGAPSHTGARLLKKNRMLFFSDEQIEKLVYQFFVKKSKQDQVSKGVRV